MKGGFYMSNRSLWMIIALLVIVIAWLVYNSSWMAAAPVMEDKKAASDNSMHGPMMSGKEGFNDKKECDKGPTCSGPTCCPAAKK